MKTALPYSLGYTAYWTNAARVSYSGPYSGNINAAIACTPTSPLAFIASPLIQPPSLNHSFPRTFHLTLHTSCSSNSLPSSPSSPSRRLH